MAMVVKANSTTNVGGHISTFASSATLYEVAFNHFLRGRTETFPGDIVFQGHAAPGLYGRAFLEGRAEQQHFRSPAGTRRRGRPASYPHPYLMPEFAVSRPSRWGSTVPVAVSGGSTVTCAWAGELEGRAESLGLSRRRRVRRSDPSAQSPSARRENLDNFIWVINCNLQRLDGPVRGNRKITQELEGLFRGAGWNVIKVIWGTDWDDLFARDKSGLLLKRMEECVDGDYQKYTVEPGSYTRKHFFGKYPNCSNW